jgi:diacylglycerol kinase (ATP)
MKAGEKNDQIKKFNVNERMRSFKNAFSGLTSLLKFEHNARIHLFVLVMAVAAGIFLKISAIDWIAIVFASGLVFISECFNTAVENLSDVVNPEQNEKIKRVKDMAAAGVLISAFVSAIIGIIIFFPEIYKLIVNR